MLQMPRLPCRTVGRLRQVPAVTPRHAQMFARRAIDCRFLRRRASSGVRACCSSARAGRRLPHHSQRVRACMRARVRARARREEHRQSMHRSIGRATTHALKASATRGSAECAATSAPPLAPLPRYPEPLPRKWVLPSGMPGCLAQGQTGARFQGGQAAQTETSARGTFTTTSRLLRITSAYM